MPEHLGPQQGEEKVPRSPGAELPGQTDEAHQGQGAQDEPVESQAVPQIREPLAKIEPADFQGGGVGNPGVEVEATKRQQHQEGRHRRDHQPTERLVFFAADPAPPAARPDRRDNALASATPTTMTGASGRDAAKNRTASAASKVCRRPASASGRRSSCKTISRHDAVTRDISMPPVAQEPKRGRPQGYSAPGTTTATQQ